MCHKSIKFSPSEIIPEKAAIYRHQDIPEHAVISERSEEILQQALEIFQRIAEPIGILAPVTQNNFKYILIGENRNDENNPVMQIYPLADELVIFALTMGSEISFKIDELFRDHDYPLAMMLDSAASVAAENSVTSLEKNHFKKIKKTFSNDSEAVLAYSPGYCGWHISGQRKLFEYLKPEKIGITLNNSHLMTPLKSVSGVLINGAKESHQFKMDYPFCKSCVSRNCRERIIRISKG